MTDRKTVTLEEPCDYSENDLERYYPVKTSDARFDRVYQSYRSLAQEIGKVSFIGRCGTYPYLDMHQVVNQSLLGSRERIAAVSGYDSATDVSGSDWIDVKVTPLHHRPDALRL